MKIKLYCNEMSINTDFINPDKYEQASKLVPITPAYNSVYRCE